MTNIRRLDTVNDYVRYVGAEVLRPYVAVVYYDELNGVRHSVYDYDVYALFLLDEFPYQLAYGIGCYDTRNGSLVVVAPGQKGGVPDDGKLLDLYGWVLLFSPDYMRGTGLDSYIDKCNFFNYSNNEALHLLRNERESLIFFIKMIYKELRSQRNDAYTDVLILSFIESILISCRRYYDRQFHEDASDQHDMLERFRHTLERYYEEKRQYREGTPGVAYCAEALCLSTNYFGDLVKAISGDTASHYIRRFVIDRAKSMLVSSKLVKETAYSLGFDYTPHFTRVFRK